LVIFSKVFIDLNGKEKYDRKLFKLIDDSSMILNIFKKGDQFIHQKIKKKNTIFAPTNSKVKIFSKFKNQMMI
jgi:hypothetical protein